MFDLIRHLLHLNCVLRVAENRIEYIWLEKIKVAVIVMKFEEVAASSKSRKSFETEEK